MPSLEKKQGHEAEHSYVLHTKLKSFLGKGLVTVGGGNGTKTDIRIGTIGVSQKTLSGKSTQTCLLTKKTLFIHVTGLVCVRPQILEFLGSPTVARKKTNEIVNFDQLLEAFDIVTKDGTLPTKMFLQVAEETPVQYISWVKKIRGGITVIDASKYVDYIRTNGEWVAAPRGTTLWLIDKTNPTKKFAHLQRKGSPSNDKHLDGQYYSPLFHIHEYWPEGTVVGSDSKFSIKGI